MKKKHISSDFDGFLREEDLLDASEATEWVSASQPQSALRSAPSVEAVRSLRLLSSKLPDVGPEEYDKL